VARGTQHRKRRQAANAPVAAKPSPKPKAKRVKHESWEDQLFFSRLRTHAKWVFLLLAIIFAFSFVIFGVGTGSSGFTDAIDQVFNSSANTGPSVSSLEEKTRENPKDAEAWRELATAHSQDDNTEEAIAALVTYTELRPKDEDSLEELGGLYLRQSEQFRQEYAEAQFKASLLQPAPAFQASASSPLAQVFQDPISVGISTSTTAASNEASTQFTEIQAKAVGVYKKLAELNPEDATTQYRLAQVAYAAGNNAEAITAYTTFLKLAPNDSLAPAARKALKDLKAPATTTTTTG
jgi:tetratricopeptide (TPR) repeat protein